MVLSFFLPSPRLIIINTDKEAMRKYEKTRRIGEGTYAVVYEGLNRATDQKVALKKIKMTSHGAGLDISAIRELRCLSEITHPNIVKVFRPNYPLNGLVDRCIRPWKESQLGPRLLRC